MKKFTTLFLLSGLLLISSLLIAQTNTDFQGTWNGTDDAGNSYELKLNANATCSFKKNGNPIYNFANYRIGAVSTTNAAGEIETSVRDALFQTNIHNNTNTQSGSLSEQSHSGFVIYKGDLKLIDAGFTHLEMSFKTEDVDEPLHFSFSR